MNFIFPLKYAAVLSRDTFVMKTFTEEGFKLDILNHKLRLPWVTFENLIADQIMEFSYIQTELPILTKQVFISIYLFIYLLLLTPVLEQASPERNVHVTRRNRRVTRKTTGTGVKRN